MVEVSRNADAAPPRVIGTLSDGDYFGEIALLRRVPRTAWVRTLTPTVVPILQRGQLLNLIDEAPELGKLLAEVGEARMTS